MVPCFKYNITVWDTARPQPRYHLSSKTVEIGASTHDQSRIHMSRQPYDLTSITRKWYHPDCPWHLIPVQFSVDNSRYKSNCYWYNVNTNRSGRLARPYLSHSKTLRCAILFLAVLCTCLFQVYIDSLILSQFTTSVHSLHTSIYPSIHMQISRWRFS